MRKHRWILAVLSLALVMLLASALLFVSCPFKARLASANPGLIVYNVYATDGLWLLADGTQLYSYGFVGGRQSDPIKFLSGQNAAKGVVPGSLITLAGTWPAPTPGPIAAGSIEAKLQGNAQFPGPLIWANVGDVVTINLKNLGVFNPKAPNDPHTIHLHGVDVDAANDGVPETSVAGVPANLVVPGAGNVITYTFVAERAGTYMYHCHQEADIHVTMGMWGAVVIYEPSTGPNNNVPGKPGSLWGWNYDRDYVMLLTDTDIRQHLSEQFAQQKGNVFNPVDYKPQYWFINGLSFPNTIHAAGGPAAPFVWANWIAAHPGMDPFIVGVQNEKVLVHLINLGFETQPMHIHGFHFKVLGSDQRQWTWTGGALEKNTITIGSGETYELLLDFKNKLAGGQNPTSTYLAATQSRYNAVSGLPAATGAGTAPAFPPIPVPMAVGLSYIGGPTVFGIFRSAAAPETAVGVPTGTVADSSQFFPWHNHDDYKATNNGVYPGGMFTMVVVLPAGTVYPAP